MATISKPGRRLARPALSVIIAVILLVLVGASFLVQRLTARPADPLGGAQAVPVVREDLTLGVAATGAVEPQVSADLAVAASGRIRAVLVVEGARVAEGDALIELDARQLQAEVVAAEAGLAIAQADLQALGEGATAAERAAAEAQIAAAQGNLTQTQGSVTAADLAAARASLEEARAALAALVAGPENDELTRARTALAQAQTNLQAQRDTLSAAKTTAQLQLDQAANALRDRQAEYDQIYWDNRDLEKLPGDLPDERVDLEAAALRAVQNAEATMAQAQVSFENARQAEVSGIQRAEADVERAQADLDALTAGADSDELAAARARVARAEAELARLTGAQRAGAIAAQQANLAQAQANLDQLLADPQSSELARAQARVAQAEAQLLQARIRLEDATLRAPFAGTVAVVDAAPGEAVGNQDTPITLIDDSRYLVKVTVDEVDIGRVRAGQAVEVLIDALGGTPMPGTVERIEARPQEGSSVTAYQVTVAITPDGRALMPGMTASATIIADRRAAALTIPAAAVREEGGRSLVDVVITGAEGARSLEAREVQLGLRVGDRVEILSGLREGEQVAVR